VSLNVEGKKLKSTRDCRFEVKYGLTKELQRKAAVAKNATAATNGKIDQVGYCRFRPHIF
jgi:hypothetical protein